MPTVTIMHSALDRHCHFPSSSNCPRLVSATLRPKIQLNSNVSISYMSFMLCTHLDMKCWDRLG